MHILKRNNYIEPERVYREILAALEKRLTPERVRHSVAVARLAGELCRREGLDPDRGRLAGIGHDIAREMSAGEILARVTKYRLRTGAWEWAHPGTLHGAVGREILKREFGLKDRAVRDAVAEHVLGRAGMGALSQILYCADFLEPERGFLAEAERAALAALPLTAMVVRVSEKIFSYLEADAKPIAPVSKKMYDYFRSKVKE